MRRAWLAFLLLAVSATARADLRSGPAWYDPTWHYRVPVSVPAASAVNSVVVVDANFATLLTELGISGTFDVNSPRVTRADGTTLVASQEFTDVKLGGVTDAAGNSQGEIRFIAQDAGAQTYWLYFDITQNGAKAATALGTRINGNFEHSAGATPTNWTIATTGSGGGHDATVITSPGAPATVNLAAGCNDNATAGVDNASNTGLSWFLLGYRSRCEDSPGNPNEFIRVSRQVAVPAGAAAGSFTYRFRYQAFDSMPSATQYDYMILDVGGTAVNHTTLGIANPVADLSIQTFGLGRNPTYGPVLLDAGWRTATLNLAPYAGTTVTLRFSMRFYTDDLYKSWVKLDDVEWSRQTATITNTLVQAFGANVTAPNDTGVTTASIYQVAQTLTIRALVQATTTAVRADVVNPSGTTVATGVILYDDGTHGDAAAGDRVFSNDGSVVANPTYTLGAGDAESVSWRVRVYARDGSSSAIGATNGHVRRSGLPNTPQDQANFWNIDEQVFTLAKVNLVLLKSSLAVSDPINGAVNPRRIPGGAVEYTIVVTNQGAGASDIDSIRLADPIPANSNLVVADLSGPGSGPVAFAQGTPTSTLAYTFTSLASLADALEFSNDGGTTWSYVPGVGGDGTDPAVTHLRVRPTGAFAARTGVTGPSFTIRFRIRVE